MGLLGLGGTEILIIIVIAAILFFGGKKIPEFAKALGRAMGEFKKGRLEVERELQASQMNAPTAVEPRGGIEK